MSARMRVCVHVCVYVCVVVKEELCSSGTSFVLGPSWLVVNTSINDQQISCSRW